MNIKKQLNGTELTISLSGALDTENAPKLEEVMNKYSPEQFVEFAFGPIGTMKTRDDKEIPAVAYGVKYNTMNRQGTMVVKNPNEVVSEVFEFTGFNDILTIA